MIVVQFSQFKHKHPTCAAVIVIFDIRDPIRVLGICLHRSAARLTLISKVYPIYSTVRRCRITFRTIFSQHPLWNSLRAHGGDNENKRGFCWTLSVHRCENINCEVRRLSGPSRRTCTRLSHWHFVSFQTMDKHMINLCPVGKHDFVNTVINADDNGVVANCIVQRASLSCGDWDR